MGAHHSLSTLPGCPLFRAAALLPLFYLFGDFASPILRRGWLCFSLYFFNPKSHRSFLPFTPASGPWFLMFVGALSLTGDPPTPPRPVPFPSVGQFSDLPAFWPQLLLKTILRFSYLVLLRPATSSHRSLTLLSIVIFTNPSGRYGATYFLNPEAVKFPSGFTCSTGTFWFVFHCAVTPLYFFLPFFFFFFLGLIAFILLSSFLSQFFSFTFFFLVLASLSACFCIIQLLITLSNYFIYILFRLRKICYI